MYIIIELQTAGGSTANIVTSYGDRNQAESKFHQILTAAAVSAVPKHAAVMLTEEGTILRNECYRHGEENDAEV